MNSDVVLLDMVPLWKSHVLSAYFRLTSALDHIDSSYNVSKYSQWTRLITQTLTDTRQDILK